MAFSLFSDNVAMLSGSIDDHDNIQLLAWLEVGSQTTQRLVLLIDSPGGKLDFEVISALILANVHTHVLLEAKSAAFLYFLCGAPRTCVERSEFALHFPQLEGQPNATPDSNIELRGVVYKIISLLSTLAPVETRNFLTSIFYETTKCSAKECDEIGHWGPKCETIKELPLNNQALWDMAIVDDIGHLSPDYLQLSGVIKKAYQILIQKLN